MHTMDARLLATEQLAGLGPRWAHVQAVGQLAEGLAGLLSPDVVDAAWLHDIGYAPSLARTGFHPIDGALYLQTMNASPSLVALVAHHTGAAFEAEERGLSTELSALPTPGQRALDALTLLDLTVGPTGELTTPALRLQEVVARYPPGDLVHLAILKSRPSLMAAVDRARTRLGLADEWPFVPCESVLEA